MGRFDGRQTRPRDLRDLRDPCAVAPVADDRRMPLPTPTVDPTLDLFAEVDRLRKERKALIPFIW